MREELIAQALHGLAVLAYGVVAFAAGILGVALELRSYAVFASGDTTLAVWMAGMGLVFLLFSVVVFRNELLTRLAHDR